MKPILAATALTLVLAACSPAASDSDNSLDVANDTVIEQKAGTAATATPNPAPMEGPAMAPDPASPAPADAKTLTLGGLGPLRIGQPVTAASGFAQRGAQIPGSDCRTVSSPDYPGVYAIVQDNAVRRITVGRNSDVKLIEGIGVGATEKQVMAAFGGFRSTPHKYVEAPAKYLTAPNAGSGDPALRFEIGRDGKVTMMHVGTMPVLGYVEGCA